MCECTCTLYAINANLTEPHSPDASPFITMAWSSVTYHYVISICVSSRDNDIDHWSIAVVNTALACLMSPWELDWGGHWWLVMNLNVVPTQLLVVSQDSYRETHGEHEWLYKVYFIHALYLGNMRAHVLKVLGCYLINCSFLLDRIIHLCWVIDAEIIVCCLIYPK